jgi:hypothetical protein
MTPEPYILILIGTEILSLAWAVQRRIARRRTSGSYLREPMEDEKVQK